MLQRSFEDMGAPLHTVPFCVLDLETTGASAATEAITEIGAVKYVGGQEVGRFQTLVNPGRSVPPMITILTGITQVMLIEAPKIEEAFPTFLEFLGDSVIVGHNVRFDMSFLNAAAIELGYGRLVNQVTDTLGLARRLVRNDVRNLKLGTLAAHFGSPVTPNHRALADAEATAHVFHSLLERVGSLGVTALEDLLTLPTARGSSEYGKIALANDLPRRPGVYFFRDRRGEVFYVGKAKNLRTRVRSYFYGDTRKSVTNMLKELVAVDFAACATELEALVIELRLIHDHKPRYNRKSKPPKSSHWVKLTNESFPRLALVRTLKEDGLMYLGPFRSRRSAETVMHAIWDALPIRRCTGRPGSRSAPCGFAQLGVSACPCDGNETAEAYGAVVADLLRGVNESPALLLQPLRTRMMEHAIAQRYEEAAWMRDRYQALARAMEHRLQWQAMRRAGSIWAEHKNGDHSLISLGRHVGSWRGDTTPLPMHDERATLAVTEVPATVLESEEARLVWKWLSEPAVTITATSEKALLAVAVPPLAA